MKLTFTAPLLVLLATERIAADSISAPLGKYTAAERRHWSFQKRRAPEIPAFTTAADRAWVKTPVDAFILASLKNPDVEENHLRMAMHTDQPVTALSKDLKRRGLLDSTFVLCGEFGRSPDCQGQGDKGRDHHNLGFTMWMAGGGIKGGQTVGATDAIGFRAIERPTHFRDIHTTLLHQLGLNQSRLAICTWAGTSA